MSDTILDIKKLCLGAGLNPKEGWTNLDMEPGPGIDVVHDMTHVPWPFPDNEFHSIEAVHVLEHIPQTEVETPKGRKDALVAVMEELYRVCAPGGRVLIEVPSVHGQGAFQDPTHRRYFVENSIYYFARPPYMVPGTPQFGEKAFERYVGMKNIPMGQLNKMTAGDKRKLVEEALAWTESPEGKMPEWDWHWHHGIRPIAAWFDCLRFEMDGKTAFLTFYLGKPHAKVQGG